MLLNKNSTGDLLLMHLLMINIDMTIMLSIPCLL